MAPRINKVILFPTKLVEKAIKPTNKNKANAFIISATGDKYLFTHSYVFVWFSFFAKQYV